MCGARIVARPEGLGCAPAPIVGRIAKRFHECLECR
jgi:hypothetical protein